MIFLKAKLAACLVISAMVGLSGPATAQEPAGAKPGGRLPDVANPPPTSWVIRRPPPGPKMPRPSMDAAPEAVAVKVSGLIRDIEGKPVAGATVQVLGNRSVDEPTLDVKTVLAGEATTGADGRYLLAGVKIPTSRDRKSPQSATPYVTFQVIAKAPGLAIGWHRGSDMYAVPIPDPDDIQQRLPLNTPVEVDIYLRPEAPLGGRVIDEAGKPVAGVAVSARNIDLLDEEGLETAFFFGTTPEFLPKGVGRATTDADGRFRLAGLPSESCCWLDFKRSGSKMVRTLYASTSAQAETTHPNPPQGRYSGRQRHTVFPSEMTVEMPTPRRLDIRVVGSDDGKPLAGVHVQSMGESLATGFAAWGDTDAEGKVAFDLPVGQQKGLCVDPPRGVESKYVRTYLRPLNVAAEPASQPVEMKMNAGGEVAIEVVDAETGKGIPGIRFDLFPDDKKPQARRLQRTPSFFDNGGVPTDAGGKLHAVIDPAKKTTYRVRIAGISPIDPDIPPEPTPEVASEYETAKPESDPFTPEAGKPVTLRFVLKKR